MKKPPDFPDARKVGQVNLGARGGLVRTDFTTQELEAAKAQNVCGHCKHFELDDGQHAMQATRFLEQLVKEHQWQVRHLANPVNQLGLCGLASGTTIKSQGYKLTAVMNPACDQFREARGLVTLRRKAKL